MESHEIYELNLQGVKTRREFHDRIVRSLPCSLYYGRNLDALYDMLSDPGCPVKELVIRRFEEFAEAEPVYMDSLKKLCGDLKELCGVLVRFEENEPADGA
ncbi:MAG: barstar family protein [Bacteroidales bacterium]|nr:barstar family protein [Lachnoclostridium sp.]MCM1385304.1 barstar family protein [Lachnoclostridium sp.]MCM1465518.1 barstar family protein [Bacteroidales bacterium]